MAWFWPIPVAIALWWLSTLALLWRLRLPEQTYPATLRAMHGVLILGVLAIAGSAQLATPLGALLAFAGALAVWSWHEATYFFGWITGPRPAGCPVGATMRQRFAYGIQASLYHEVLVVLTVLVLGAALWQGANTVALQTFIVLWLMRWSSKLNIFVGVNNLHMEYWPSHLKYLESYVGAASNRVFPLSVVLAAGLAYWLVQPVLGQAQSNFDVASVSLLLTLLALAIVEHICLLVPVPDALLWSLARRDGLTARGRREH